MKRASRFMLLATAAVTALTLVGAASTAPAALTAATKLNIRTQGGLGATGPVTLEVSLSPTDDPLAKFTLYTGLGYTANLTAASGTTIGSVTAQVTAADLGGATLPISGQIQAADAATTITVAGQTIPLSAAGQLCTGTPTHAAFWLLVLTAGGQTLRVAAFVDPASGAETQFAAYKVQVCLPPPDVPASDPRRATFGIRVIEAKLTLAKVFTNPTTPGQLIWSAFFTPYAPGTGNPNPAGTVEARSATIVPAGITLIAKYNKKRRAAILAGRLTGGGQGISGITVPIYAGSKPTSLKSAGRTAKTNSQGLFGAVKKILKTTYFQVGGILGGGDVTAAVCGAFPSQAPGGCVSGTIGEIPVLSPIRKVVVPKTR